MPENSEYLTIQQAVDEYHISKPVIFKYFRLKLLTKYEMSLPKRLMVKRSEIEALRRPKPSPSR